jgi:hypothetical protein
VPGLLSDYQVGTAGTFVQDNLEADRDPTEERLTGVVAQALDEPQDHVDEAAPIPLPQIERSP